MPGLFDSDPNITEPAQQFLFVIAKNREHFEELRNMKNLFNRKIVGGGVADELSLGLDVAVVPEIVFD